MDKSTRRLTGLAMAAFGAAAAVILAFLMAIG
jgi:hypothetical protein